MRYSYLPGAAVFAAAIMTAPAFAETKTYAVADFTRVSASAGVSVDITAGADYAVRASSSAEGLERLEIKVVEGELQIRRKSKGWRWKRGDEVNVTVSLPALEAVDVSSGASVDATGVDAGAFAIDVSSGGSLDIAGKCDALTVDVSSGGSVDADEFLCRSANASASSGGSADIYASESVNGDASSGGSVDVSGSPKTVNKDTSSGGSIDVD
ncbi:MAG: head GIN domain-containing protein [Parvularculaceae bacterium]|nr:head GIN domain-containing protein [Parvularculaceae bacterium]